jgi:hypothetical protein
MHLYTQILAEFPHESPDGCTRFDNASRTTAVPEGEVRVMRRKNRIRIGRTKRDKKRYSSRRQPGSGLNRPPRSAEELFARPRKFQDVWNRAVQVPAEMRAHGLSLPQAARQFGLSTATVLRLALSAFRKSSGRYKVRPTDRLLRVLQIPSKLGLAEIALKDSREASFVGAYWSAVEKLLVNGDASALLILKRRTVKDATGKRVKLLFDVDELKRQASAGVLHFESIYGRRA